MTDPAVHADEAARIAIGAALIRSGVYDNDDMDLLQWHPCEGCPRRDGPRRGKCACSGVPYVADAVWKELGPVIAAIAANGGGVGRCGDLMPTVTHAPRQVCTLPAGHEGWHRGDGQPFPAEWGDLGEPKPADPEVVRRTRRELLAHLTRDSIDMGLYDLPAPEETP